MILQAIERYYDRIPDAPPQGFQYVEIPFIVVLDETGKFMGITDTRTGKAKKKRGRVFLMPRPVKRSSGILPNLLWDNPAYVFGEPTPDKKKDPARQKRRAQDQHQSFLEKIKKIFPKETRTPEIEAVLKFLETNKESVKAHPLWEEIITTGGNITFQIQGKDELVCQSEQVKEAVVSLDESEMSDNSICLITGELDIPVRLHASIKGVWGAQSSGANIISFNLSAFSSYGKEQGLNAPVGKRAEFRYTTALNELLKRDSRHRIQVGDATTVFWAEKEHEIEDWFYDIFGTPEGISDAHECEAIRALFKSPETGAPPYIEDPTRFYVLGLAPNAARIAVRFWYAGTVGEVQRNIIQHFNDLKIVHREGEPEYLSVFKLLVSTAAQGKADNIPPNLSGDLMKAILSGIPYPQTLLSAAVRRIRAERVVSYPRAAIIRAVLARKARYYNIKGKEVGMPLDRENPNPGYRLGRLFAVLEKIQEEANPGINATIRDRFYGAASSSPAIVFPQLMKLKNHHLSKIPNPGRVVNFEKLIGEILEDLADFPNHLSLEDQGRFAIGYYHQRHDFFK